jgi:hypothetical protein
MFVYSLIWSGESANVPTQNKYFWEVKAAKYYQIIHTLIIYLRG